MYYRLIGVQIKGILKFKKTPSLYKVKGAKIIVGKNVTINSDNFRYHINMHSRCKIIADRNGAEITIDDNTRINGTCIHAYNRVSIGKNVLIAANTQIIDGNGHQLSFDDVSKRISSVDSGRPIVIEDNVWIGANCIILGGAVVGYGSVISANSVVKTNIPPMCIAEGNPAVVIKKFN